MICLIFWGQYAMSYWNIGSIKWANQSHRKWKGKIKILGLAGPSCPNNYALIKW